MSLLVSELPVDRRAERWTSRVRGRCVTETVTGGAGRGGAPDRRRGGVTCPRPAGLAADSPAAELEGAELERAELERAQPEGAEPAGAQLDRAQLDGGQLEGLLRGLGRDGKPIPAYRPLGGGARRAAAR